MEKDGKKKDDAQYSTLTTTKIKRNTMQFATVLLDQIFKPNNDERGILVRPTISSLADSLAINNANRHLKRKPDSQRRQAHRVMFNFLDEMAYKVSINQNGDSLF